MNKRKMKISLVNSGKIILEQDYQPELSNLGLLLASLYFFNTWNHHHESLLFADIIQCTPSSPYVHHRLFRDFL